MIRQPQTLQTGASFWIAHSKQSNIQLSPSRRISKALS